MWHEITTPEDLSRFLQAVHNFHDSCIKEMKYLSGAYVNENLSMHPLNDQRILTLLIQRQFQPYAAVELEFSGLKSLQFTPCGPEYTCEITDAAMFFKDGCIFWCDSGSVSQTALPEDTNTIVCAEKLRWRALENGLGERERYCTAP